MFSTADLKQSDNICRFNGLSAVRGTDVRMESQIPVHSLPRIRLIPAGVVLNEKLR